MEAGSGSGGSMPLVLYVLDGAGKRVIQPRTKPDHCYGPNRYYTDPSDEIRKPRPECV